MPLSAEESIVGADPATSRRVAERAREFHIPSLDGLRAVAFFMVFFSHVGATNIIPGGFGVTIFFFLSGFLITTLLRLESEACKTISLKRFYLRRILRIFPPMYIALAVAVALSIVAVRRVSPWVVAIQALQLTNYHVALERMGHPMGTQVLWSLSVEEHFYLVFPLCYIGLRRLVHDPSRQATVLLLACCATLAWRAFLALSLGVKPEYTMHATDTRVDSILFGCALAVWRNPALPGPQLPPRWVWTLFALAMIVLVGSVAVRNAVFRETLRYTLQGLALGPVFIAAIRFPKAAMFRALNWGWVRFLGVLSYSLYLVHVTVLEFARPILAVGEWPLALVGAVVSLLLATALHYGVERPCANLRKRLSRVPLVRDRASSTAEPSSASPADRNAALLPRG